MYGGRIRGRAIHPRPSPAGSMIYSRQRCCPETKQRHRLYIK
jgi:hypothetical protein